MGPKAKGAEYITIGGSAELRSPSDPPTCGLVGPYFYPATPSYPYIFLFYVINIKRKRDGGGGAVFLEQKKVGSPSSYPPLYRDGCTLKGWGTPPLPFFALKR